ncbi:uncharacterized protein Bfra_000038 [Botrytis fragariae]|uniref:Uncharacterized protein n=1 Tax=Botrytis fragariae TaxID=1964551 RepID=A0A8H6EMJ9_9HELO|nr:uncharacterized protein Bfra_000038 [Botrytis fragariae]KAF5877876.1 hypothetical protein Bfra_000038 [Botrytis fragariae]
MPAITRSKSPSKKAPADPNQASSAANTYTNVAPVANMLAPRKEALAGAKNALSDAMVPALAPLSPSKRKRSAKTISGDEGVGAQTSEPMKRTRVERSDAPRSRPTSGQPDLATTTYPQVERVILGLEDTPVFGTAGGAPKESLDAAAASTPTPSPKAVKTTAAAPVLDGEENGATAKAPISAVTVTAGQADDETVVEQPSPHPAADSADPLTANEAEAHLPAAPQGCSSSDLEVAKEELGAPKISITNKCKCDELAAKVQKMARLEAELRESRDMYQRELEAAVEERDAIEIKEEEARKEYNRIRENLKNHLELTHQLRSDRGRLSKLNDDLKRENDRLAQKNRELKDTLDKYCNAVDVLNAQVPLFTSDQEKFEKTRELLRVEAAKTAEYEGQFQEAANFFAADEVVESIEPVDPAQGSTSHENHNHEEHTQEDRSRRYRTPTPDNNRDNFDEVYADDDDDANNIPPPAAPPAGAAGTQQSQRASSFAGFQESSRWECRHDRGYNGNTCRHCGAHVLAEEHPEFDRDRSVALADELPPSPSDEEERDSDSASYEPAEAVINTQDESQQVGSPVLSGNEDYEENDQEDESQHEGPSDFSDDEYYDNENPQDHQEPPHPAAAVEKTTVPHPAAEVEKTTSAPSEPHSSSSPSPSSSKKRKESPVSASSPAKKVKSTKTELAGPSSTAAPHFPIEFKPAHPGWGSPSVLSPQIGITAPAPSTSSSASERTTAAPLLPTVITRSGAAVQFGAATIFGAICTARSSVRFESTHSFGIPALSAANPSVGASPKEENTEEDKPADQKK